MAITRLVGSILPDFLKVVDLGERFLGLGSHTKAHRKKLENQKKKVLLPIVKRILHKILTTRGIRTDVPGLAKLKPGKGVSKKRGRKTVTVSRKRQKLVQVKKPKMRKRRRGGSHTVAHMLHGGTGDLKPQYMTISTIRAGSVDDYTATRISLPVSHFGDQKSRTTIFEILRVEWYLNADDAADTANSNIGFLSTTLINPTGKTCTLASMSDDFANSLVLAPAMRHIQLLTSGVFQVTWPICIDTTDSAGNGILVATDVLFITHGNVAGNAVGRVTAKVMYRLSSVGITEYVGILQAQQ